MVYRYNTHKFNLSDNNMPMETVLSEDKSQRKIELLQILVEGCRKHPAYRARRAATQRCKECIVVWNARLELKDMSD